MDLRDALALALLARQEGYVGTYPKALVALADYIAHLEAECEGLRNERNNGQRLQIDGPSPVYITAQQGPEHESGDFDS